MKTDDNSLCVVQTTLPSEAQAVELAAALVQQHWAACVQIVASRSFYNWQGELQDEAEWLLNIKTRLVLSLPLQAWLRARHPYGLSEFVVLPITQVSPAYRDWVLAQTADAQS